jgi:type I restriction enzyme, S subunit
VIKLISEKKITIPKSWKLTQLGEVIELKYGKSLIKSKRDGGNYFVYGSNGVVGSHSKCLIDKSCLIVGRKGSIGEVTLSESPCWAIDTTYYIDELHKQPINFWFYRLKALNLDKLDRASAVPGLNREDAYKLIFPLPPLNEQKRIVTKIEALQTRSTAVKEELKAIKPLLNQFRQSVLAAAFRGDLTKDWRSQNPNLEPAEMLLERIKIERRRRWEEVELEKMKVNGKVPKDDKWKNKYKEPEPIDTEGLPELPNGWCWVSIEQISELVTDGDHNPPKKADRVPEGIPHLTAKNIINWTISEEGCTYITEEDFERIRKRYYPNVGDVVITCVGTLGRTAIVPDKYIFSADRNLAVVRLISNGISSECLLLSLNTTFSQKLINQASGSTAQPHFYLAEIRSFPVQLIPIKEQKEIVRCIESLFKLADNIEQQYQQAETNLETLNQSILAKAFRGELVPQDPNDEPASVLLERIRAERDRATAKPKNSKTEKKRSSEKEDKQLGIPGI